MQSYKLRRGASYIALVEASARAYTAYRSDLLFRVIGMALQVYLLTMLWTAAYADREVVDGVRRTTMITYLLVTNVQIWVTETHVQAYLYDRIREGRIIHELSRPVSLLQQLWADQLGYTIGRLPGLLLAVPLAGLAGGLHPPESVVNGVMYLLSFSMGFAISYLIGLLLGIVAFWTLDSRGFNFVVLVAGQFLSGAFIPLWFMPDWARAILEILPFQAIGFVPAAVYVGQFTGTDLVQPIATQVFWIILLASCALFFWRRAMNRINVQGG